METKLRSSKVTVSDDTNLWYQRAGSGRQLILIPGWSMTSMFFERQLRGLNKEFDVIAYDPRSQGKSANPDVNNFDRRGVDLADLISSLGLTSPTVVAWSLGVVDLYSYLKQFGDDKLAGMVFVDQGPKTIPADDHDWTFGDLETLSAFFGAFRDKPDEAVYSFLSQCIRSEIDKSTLSRLVTEVRKTPRETALFLLADGWFRNYESLLSTLEKPTLHIVSEDSADSASQYLSRFLSEPRITAFGGHMMFWDEPQRFNKCIKDFMEDS